MKFKLAQTIGLNTDQKAAQVASSQRDNDLFIGLVKIECDDAFTRGRQLLSELADFYLEEEGNPADRLTSTFAQAQNRTSDVESPDLLLAAISGKVLYLMSQGAVTAYLFRSNKLHPLLKVESSGQLISGFLEHGDRILLSTDSLVSFLGDDLEETLQLTSDEWEDEIESKISLEKELDSESLAGLILDAKDETGVASDKSTGQDEKGKPLMAQTVHRTTEPQTESDPLSQDEQRENATEPKPSVLNFQSTASEQASWSKTSKLTNVLSLLVGLKDKIPHILPKSNKAKVGIALALLVILLVGLGYKFYTHKQQETNRLFNQYYQQAQNDYSEALNVKDSNLDQSKQKLSFAKDNIEKALSVKPNNKQAADLKQTILSQIETSNKEANDQQLPLYLDLDLVKKGFQGNFLSLSSGKLLTLDPTTKTLVLIDLGSKKPTILAGEQQLGQAVLSTLGGDFALIYSKNKGVVRVSIANQKDTTAIGADSGWGDIADIASYSGNIYLLDKSGKIWKYTSGSSGYSDKKSYLSSDTKVDSGNAQRMQVETSLYVLLKDGSILRFTKGSKDSFSYSGLDKAVKDPKSFFTSLDTENLYLLDSGNSRILVLSKTGEFKKQYQSGQFSNASDLAVDEKNQKVYLLVGSKIYQMDLK